MANKTYADSDWCIGLKIFLIRREVVSKIDFHSYDKFKISQRMSGIYDYLAPAWRTPGSQW
jgi:hypothetical protein